MTYTTRHFSLSLITAAVVSLTACGGGGDDETALTPTPTPTPTSTSTSTPTPTPRAAQTITFAKPAAQTAGTTMTLDAAADSGLAIVFNASPATTCTVTGKALTLAAAGTCTVTASQTGNTGYAAATDVVQNVTVAAAPVVAPKAQVITFAAPANQTLGVAPSALVATSDSALAVSFASTTPSVCTVNGTTLTLVAAGSCSITATQTGNASFSAATAVVRSVTVAAAPVVNSAANGKVLYTSNSVLSCAGCHGMPPSLQKVLNGANKPMVILDAINQNAGGMGMYVGKFSTQQLNDMAAYLATPNL